MTTSSSLTPRSYLGPGAINSIRHQAQDHFREMKPEEAKLQPQQIFTPLWQDAQAISMVHLQTLKRKWRAKDAPVPLGNGLRCRKWQAKGVVAPQLYSHNLLLRLGKSLVLLRESSRALSRSCAMDAIRRSRLLEMLSPKPGMDSLFHASMNVCVSIYVYT